MSKHLPIIGLIISLIGLGFYFQWPAITQGWPFLIFLLCPLMHMFMGHDHGGGGHNHDGSDHKEHQHSSDKKKKDGASCH